ncbi:SUKH-4 family immunity protein [Streptomyces sp. NPDC091272]|uniref:SUKH-4 family immunity protein n=1 Tax=Streptomyces sp. NPDC091272 TaxID=3365981 RepID=UPI00382DBA4D
MLFDVTCGRLAGIFGEHRLATLPPGAFPPAAVDSEGARLLQTVGAPTGTLHLRGPDGETGRPTRVRDVVDTVALELEEVLPGTGEWPVVGWLLNTHVALDPGTGKVYAFDADEGLVRELHTDVSSLIQVTVRFQRLLDEFTFDGDEESEFERLEGEVELVRRETARIDPLPFRDDESPWSVVGDEIAAGQRFTADSPGGRTLYG